MGVILRWKIPDLTEVTYTKAYIYRAGSENGTYNEIANQAITDNTYFDVDGDSTFWYKVRFYDSVNTKWSDYSSAMQGGDFSGYCTIDEIRTLGGVPTTVTDSQLYDLMPFAHARINRDILIERRDEEVLYIDEEKQNQINGTNTTFYTKYSPLGDLDDNGIINTNDIEVYSLDTNGNRIEYTISSIDDSWLGKFTLSSAPSSTERLYIKRYRSSPVTIDPPDYLVRLAAVYLVSAMAFNKLDPKGVLSYRVGKISVKQKSGFKNNMDNYIQTINMLKSPLVHMKSGEVRKSYHTRTQQWYDR